MKALLEFDLDDLQPFRCAGCATAVWMARGARSKKYTILDRLDDALVPDDEGGDPIVIGRFRRHECSHASAEVERFARQRQRRTEEAVDARVR